MVPVTQLRSTCPAASAERFSRTHQPSKLTSDQKAVSRKWNSRQIEKNRRKEILITKWLQRLLPCSWHIKPIIYSNNKFQWLANTDLPPIVIFLEIKTFLNRTFWTSVFSSCRNIWTTLARYSQLWGWLKRNHWLPLELLCSVINLWLSELRQQ